MLRPAISTADAPTWPLAAAVAVADAVAAEVGDDAAVEIKWPNDVLLGGRKTCGILMELGAEAARVTYMVLGIGVNLNVERERFPDEFRRHATSLSSHCGQPVDRIAFARTLFAELEAVLDGCAAGGFASLRERFEARFHMVGRRVVVRDLEGEALEGTALGVDELGALRLALSSGEERRVLAGDVTLAKEGV